MKFIGGIGGVMLYSSQPRRLLEWYRACLGFDAQSDGGECSAAYATFDSLDIDNPKITRTTAWAILPIDASSNGQPRTAQINYRVNSMAELLAHLKTMNVTVEKTETYPYGHFAWIKDPDGNQIELWEPTE
jgi:predicted enzyme related to lactoylglutathione lyase